MGVRERIDTSSDIPKIQSVDLKLTSGQSKLSELLALEYESGWRGVGSSTLMFTFLSFRQRELARGRKRVGACAWE